jgi:hypothetical protein
MVIEINSDAFAKQVQALDETTFLRLTKKASWRADQFCQLGKNIFKAAENAKVMTAELRHERR